MRGSTRSIATLTAPLVAVSLAACAPRAEREMTLETHFTPAQTLSASTRVGAAPMFAVSRTGSEAAAWVSAPDSGSDGRLYVSVGNADPVELRDALGPIEAHGEAPPKLAYGADGALNAIYVVGKEVPGARFPLAALRFVRSRDGGRTWSAPVTVTSGAEFGSHNFHALHAASDGTIYVSWLGGPGPKSGTWIANSTDNGKTWSRSVRVDLGEACPCCRTALATAPDGTLFIAWRGVLTGGIRDVVIARSSDRGATWSAPMRVHADDWQFDGCPHAGPSMQTDSAGRIHIAWWTGKEGAAGVWYARSTDGGRSFEKPAAIGVASYSRPAHAQLALGAKGLVGVTWDDGTVQTPSIQWRLSRDGGSTFGPTTRLSDEGRSATFPVLAISDSSVVVAWSERSRHSAEHAEKMAPDMKKPGARMGLKVVGDAQVLVRRAKL